LAQLLYLSSKRLDLSSLRLDHTDEFADQLGRFLEGLWGQD
jgi:hypothetical protein